MELGNKAIEKEEVWKSENLDKVLEKPIYREDKAKIGELSDILRAPIDVNKVKEYIESTFNFNEKINEKDIIDLVETIESSENDIENMDSERLQEIREKYPKIDNMLSSIEDRLQNLENVPEEEKEKLKKDLDQQIKMFKGHLVEAILKESLEEKFREISKVEIQKDTSEGKTKIDITCREAKKDFTIGNTEIKKGEDLYIESKIGDKDYIAKQMEHMKKQIEGHHNAGNESENGYKSVIVVSADYREVSEAKRDDFEKHLEEVGTDLVVLEKSAEDIDNKVKDCI